MPVITIQQLPQDVEAKRRLAAEITRAVVEQYQVAPEKVQIFFQEADAESWSKGGRLGVDRHSTAAP